MCHVDSLVDLNPRIKSLSEKEPGKKILLRKYQIKLKVLSGQIGSAWEWYNWKAF